MIRRNDHQRIVALLDKIEDLTDGIIKRELIP